MADTRAAARSAGVAFVSHILFDFNGPLTQSGPTAPKTTDTRGAIANQLAKTIVRESKNYKGRMPTFWNLSWTLFTTKCVETKAADVCHFQERTALASFPGTTHLNGTS
jgi:hypothetical protein